MRRGFVGNEQINYYYWKMAEEVNDQWRTTNQNYGGESNANTSTLRQKFARSTLDELKKGDVNQFIHQQQNIAQRFRHGLFTQPPGLSVGDQYRDSKPDECTKNITVNQKLKDRVQPELFSRLGSTNIGDPYKDKYKEKQLYELDKNNLNPHGRSFVPSNNGKKIKHSEYQHMAQYPHKSYDTRDGQGNVKTGKRNFSTNPMKKGYGNSTTGHLFGSYAYESNPYDAERQHNKKQRLEHKAKIGAPFVGKSHTNNVFTPDYVVHDGTSGHLPLDQIEKNQTRGVSHPKFGPWIGTNPAKKGYNATFEKFPQYIEQGQKERERVKHQDPWIHNFNGTSKNFGQTLSKPCPVPSQMVLNDLRRK